MLELRFSSLSNLKLILMTYITVSLAFPERSIVIQLLKEIHVVNATWKFITISTKACHRFVSRVSSYSFTSLQQISHRFILVLSSHLHFRLPYNSSA